jgi:hypothetical protein
MLTVNPNNVQSKVKGVICLVIEEVNGQIAVTTHGTQKLTDVAGLFSATPNFVPALAAAPEKPVEIIPTTPVSASNEPTLAELKAEAKALHVKGWQLPAIKAETLKRKIAEKKAAPQPASPAPSAPVAAAPQQQKPGGFKGKGGKPMKKDSFKLSKCSKALIRNKDRSKIMTVYICEVVRFSEKAQYHIDENKAHGLTGEKANEGYVVCSPDEGGINPQADTIFGGTWVIPASRFVQWCDK